MAELDGEGGRVVERSKFLSNSSVARMAVRSTVLCVIVIAGWPGSMTVDGKR
jgi:hypothetical protein